MNKAGVNPLHKQSSYYDKEKGIMKTNKLMYDLLKAYNMVLKKLR